MDPNANLNEQRELMCQFLLDWENGRTSNVYDMLRLAELVEALDHWLSMGGFPSDDWQRQA